jgi:hypothetical protein
MGLNIALTYLIALGLVWWLVISQVPLEGFALNIVHLGFVILLVILLFRIMGVRL